MAARTGASIGVAVTITILGLLSLAFFITTMVFYGQAQDAKKRARDAETAAETFVRGPERDSERVRAVRELANRDRQSVTAYLITALRDSMQLAAGNPDLTIDEFKTRVAEVEGSDANSLLGVIGVRNDRIAALQDELAQSDAARQAAVDRAQEEAARADALAGEFRDAGDQLRTKVDDYGQIVQTYSTGVDSIEERFKAELDAAKQAADERERDLRARLQEFTNANLVLQDQLSRLRGEGAVDRVRPRAEEALVDATIDQVVPTDNEVVLGHFGAEITPTLVAFALAKTLGFAWGADAAYDALDCNTLASGDVDVVTTTIQLMLPCIESVTILAAVTADRVPMAPDAPTVAEVAPDLGLVLWNGLFVRKEVPQDVRDKIAAVAKATMESERAKKFAADTGAQIYWKDAAAATAQIAADRTTLEAIGAMLAE